MQYHFAPLRWCAEPPRTTLATPLYSLYVCTLSKIELNH